MALLKANGLYKSYKKREILSGISIHVNSAEVVGLLGPNGAGKTTCFYMIVGLVTADKGSITIDDDDLTSLPIHKRA
ncbi:MAG TPA: ATP-binding cassette domain-containing protein, partial [Thiotrichaceae bacterium]|nr:ATP-binding cassette domain-containing protein [Thiotrichaceae bacterium]